MSVKREAARDLFFEFMGLLIKEGLLLGIAPMKDWMNIDFEDVEFKLRVYEVNSFSSYSTFRILCPTKRIYDPKRIIVYRLIYSHKDHTILLTLEDLRNTLGVIVGNLDSSDSKIFFDKVMAILCEKYQMEWQNISSAT